MPPDDVARLKANKAVHRVWRGPPIGSCSCRPNTGADTAPAAARQGRQAARRLIRCATCGFGRRSPLRSTATALVERVLSGQGVPTYGDRARELCWVTSPGVDRAERLTRQAPANCSRRCRIPGRFQDDAHACTNDRYVNDARICQTLAQMLSRGGITTAGGCDARAACSWHNTRIGKNQAPIAACMPFRCRRLRDVAYILGTCGALRRMMQPVLATAIAAAFPTLRSTSLIEAAITRSDAGREAALQEAQSGATVAQLGHYPDV